MVSRALRLMALFGPLWLTAGCFGEATGLTPTPGGVAPLPNGPGDEGDPAVVDACAGRPASPGPAPLRRLTREEYNNTVRDLLGDTTSPANALPAEELGNGFGNDAASQSVSSLLVSEWSRVAEEVATRATATPAQLAKVAPCAAGVTAQTEAACVRSYVESFATAAYRRPVSVEEVDELASLHAAARSKAPFAVAVATVVEAVLQSPDFLYRVEWGVPDPANPALRRPSGDEMAVRLSYLFWGTQPDETLRAAARAGELETTSGVRAHAERMLNDARARPMLRFFFDNLLPLRGLTDTTRDKALFPTFSAQVGAYMREETQRFLEHEIFEGSGSWAGVLTAPYTFVNAPLATFYGMDTAGLVGTTFQKVPLDTTRRLGLLTQGGVMTGTTHSNLTSPVLRGSFLAHKFLCLHIPLPTGEILAQVKPPEPTSGKTARERYGAHSSDPVCAGCHQSMDPLGLALENFDAVGLYREQENGVTIDASGGVPGVEGTVNGPVELARKLAETPAAQACFASHWLTYAYGRELTEADDCTEARVQSAFRAAGYDVRALLLALAQTDAFLYLPPQEP